MQSSVGKLCFFGGRSVDPHALSLFKSRKVLVSGTCDLRMLFGTNFRGCVIVDLEIVYLALVLC